MQKTFKFISSRWLAILHDLLMINVGWIAAFILRFDTFNLDVIINACRMLPIVVITHSISCWWMGLYRGVWRFASIPDLSRIIKAIFLGSLFTLLILFFINRLDTLPRSVIIIYNLLLLVSLGGSRFLVRKFKDSQSALGKHILIIGANQYGESLARELLRDAHTKETPEIPVVFIDNDLTKQGQEIHGLRVAGGYKDLALLIEKYKIDLIAITMPLLSAKEKKEVITIAEQAKLPVRILPSAAEIISGKISINALREISIEDLLGREEVNINWQGIKKEIYNKIILVTGAGGSIGSELCRQLIKLDPNVLIILDNSEYNLFSITEELTDLQNKLQMKFILKRHLIDVCDESAVLHIMEQYKPDVVFHAAAFKHVPMLEDQIRAAVKNNILGTMIMSRSAIKLQVKKFVLVSTDKAVNPINIMGISKRIAEMICQQSDKIANTRFIAVRFGNVLGSVGSVVPTFKKQLESGGPITVTHPSMARFFMTIVEACQLILQSLSLGRGGETFVLDMGEPIKIKDLAEKMIRLSGKILDVDIKIAYTGLRPGERLQETLFYQNEKLANTKHQQIQIALPYNLNWQELSEIFQQLETACINYDEKKLHNLLQAIINSEIKYEEYINV